MKKGIVLLIILFNLIYFKSKTQTIYNFKIGGKFDEWHSVNDDVMGGISNGELSLSNEGHGVFTGKISLENNGGFSSIRYNVKKLNLNKKKIIKLKIKGDGKRYQFRIKKNLFDYHSYITYFETNGNWEVIEINLNEMYPSFRGNKINKNLFDGNYISQIAILYGNRKTEPFTLLIDKIYF
tara:strand:+ start:952 stop:1494 length:543 start_codon:yes stop_codon:yes gene_type:complete